MATQVHTTTADELLAMPRDGVRRELVEGEVREMTPAGWRHARVARNVFRSLDEHAATNRLGEVYPEFGYRLDSDPDTVRAPDVSFVRAERAKATGDPEGYFPGAPDLAVEVVSPNDRYREVTEKVDDYFRAGTRMVLLVDPGPRTVKVLRSPTDLAVLTEDGVIDGGDVVPGWTLPVRDVFA